MPALRLWACCVRVLEGATRRSDRLAFTYYQVSPSLTSTERLEQAFGLPPTYQFGVQTHAMVLEANYSIPVHPGIQIQPEFEWFVRPGGVSTVPDAVVLGLKTHVLF